MNNYSIEYLKKIITDGMEIKPKLGDSIYIKRLANNIIKIHRKPISWVNLRELLISGEYSLIVKEKETNLFVKKHGGARIAGPGKKIGRTKLDPLVKKKIQSYTLDPLSIVYLEQLANYFGVTKSSYIENLIKSDFESMEPLLKNNKKE